MIKVIFVFIAATALMAYFLRDTLLGDGVTEKTGIKSFERIASLPGEISESSGVVALYGQNQFLTHNDAGNKPYLYKLNSRGNIQETIKLKLPNVDWEDLAMDNEGNIYIADTGNNNNGRKELAVYKINLNSPSKVEAIRFTYEDQKKYPPPKKERNFDSEAAFWADGNIYLISKDRGRGELAKVYRLPDKAGQYKAQLIGSHRIKAQITGAAISPDAETVVLLSEEKLHIFSDFSSPDKFYEGSYKEVELDDAGQTEGVAFEDDASLIITSEGGSLYRYKL
ncbi:hypothetical protein ACFSRY_07165 [Pontibacter locisalis]|uniref:Uncharacterized protein n=1 Tax=Pontibacter locisalis TaxID=1719035 RepID=A0ABW5IJ28_9BACT